MSTIKLKANQLRLPALDVMYMALKAREDGSGFSKVMSKPGETEFVIKVKGNINTDAGREVYDIITKLNKQKVRQLNYDKELHEMGLPGADAEGNFAISFKSKFQPKVYNEGETKLDNDDIPFLKLNQGDSAKASVIITTKEGKTPAGRSTTYINLAGVVLTDVHQEIEDEPENLGGQLAADHS